MKGFASALTLTLTLFSTQAFAENYWVLIHSGLNPKFYIKGSYELDIDANAKIFKTKEHCMKALVFNFDNRLKNASGRVINSYLNEYWKKYKVIYRTDEVDFTVFGQCKKAQILEN